MKPYIITYEIKPTATSNYEKLFEEIKKHKKWWHYLENSWIVMSGDSANQIFSKFETHLDENINLLVIELGKDRQGWLTEKAWTWIKNNIF